MQVAVAGVVVVLLVLLELEAQVVVERVLMMPATLRAVRQTQVVVVAVAVNLLVLSMVLQALVAQA
jgi:hypothetical protein